MLYNGLPTFNLQCRGGLKLNKKLEIMCLDNRVGCYCMNIYTMYVQIIGLGVTV